MLPAFRRLWRIPWAGLVKEPFWLLAYDAIPTPARVHQAERTCGCGVLGADRVHQFWTCPAAAAVRMEIVNTAGLVALHHSEVWLAICPTGLDPGVWDVVCLAAIAAMDKARRFMARQMALGEASGGRVLGERGAARGRLVFWELLQEYAALGLPPRRSPMGAELGENHPFLCMRRFGLSHEGQPHG